ncbi:hypothetical protein ACFRAM_17005 [Paenibacillus sp. NPDC056722]|uniref:hypothetical protein n=1 Tax=Paenibacillus sp. NPDC056722 TaxID=3345924 RepID=UPI0036CBA77A
MTSPGRNKKTTVSSSRSKNGASADRSIQALLNGGKNLEIIVAALLLTGKLNVDSVTIFKQATLLVGLTGKYKTLIKNANVDNMVKFLNDNGDMTIDEVLQAFTQKSQKG